MAGAKCRLVLASASPRRKELLAQIGAEFDILPARGEEHISTAKPEQAVIELSRQKAEEVAGLLVSKKGITEKTVVLGADTIVAFQGEILGKPKSREDAARMLRMLSGNTHSVFTGVAAILLEHQEAVKTLSFFEETKVTMYLMTEGEIKGYVATGEPMDKAGAYGIQGKCAIYIEKIAGDYNNVVGLPVAALYQRLSKSGIEIL
ncbi:MAG: septum formation protein Maf [Lachnospiraceae bacterium]|nr:septum formation protein Maf [Lachnospiraceae bacterium]